MHLSSARKNRNEKGSVLLTSVLGILVVGIMVMTYLKVSTNQFQLTVRSQVWNSALSVAEAGLEEALAHLTANHTNPVSSGWQLSGTNYTRTNRVGDGYYALAISTNRHPAVFSTGYHPMPGSSILVSRSVRVTTYFPPVFPGALMTREEIDLKGNPTVVDSYDSRDPAKSTNGHYDPAKTGDQGNLVSMAGVISTGNGNIYGNVLSPAGGSMTTGPNGRVGSTSWNHGPKKGIEPGWEVVDPKLEMPDVTAPFDWAPAPVSGVIDGIFYNYVLKDGPFMLLSMIGKVAVTGNAVVYVLGDIDTTSLVISTNSIVQIYAGGSEVRLDGIDNRPAKSSALRLYAMPSVTSVTWSGTSMAAVYAPSAEYLLNGNFSMSGSMAVKRIRIVGNGEFHYDEALALPPSGRRFNITSWEEL